MPGFKNQFACLANLPPVSVLLMEALQQLDGKQDLTTLVDKISLDPSITVRILRIVNSPFYGMSREIGSLREAIVLLGFNRIRDILVSIGFSKIMPASHEDFNYRHLWHHSMAVAECTRQLAGLSGNSLDFAFTAGLLHDIGRLLIVVLFPDEFSRLVKVSAHFGIETEQELLGFNHATIGGKAAQYWNLPQQIQEAIEQHETPPEPGSVKSLGLLVYIANLLIVKMEQADDSAWENCDAICTALAILNISIEQAVHCANNGLQFAKQILSLS